MHIGLFGGSFNPPHVGHGLVCYYLLETTGLEKIWLLPTYKHAFDKELAPFPARVRMCELLATPFGGHVVVSTAEWERGGTSYTIDTVQFLLAHHPGHTFEWIIGADILEEASRWKDFDRLKGLVDFRVLGRQGYSGGPAIVMPNVSSTDIRRRLAGGRPIDDLVPRAVRAYIEDTGLYAGGTPAAPATDGGHE